MLGAHGQATATRKDFGHFDCFWQLRMWSCKYSECFKEACAALKYCNQTFMCMLYQTVPANFEGDAWGAWPTQYNP